MQTRHGPPEPDPRFSATGRRDPKFLAVIALQASDTNRKSENSDARAFADQQVADARRLHPRITQRWSRMTPTQKERLHARLWADSQRLYEKRLRSAKVAVTPAEIQVPPARDLRRVVHRTLVAIRSRAPRRQRRASATLAKTGTDPGSADPDPAPARPYLPPPLDNLKPLIVAVLVCALASLVGGYVVGAIAATLLPAWVAP